MVMSMKEKTKLARKRRRLRKKIESIGPFVQGTVVSLQRICGSKNCACRRGGKKHPATLITWKENGKTKALYVPRKLEAQVKVWAQNYKKLKDLIDKISDVQKAIIKLRE